MNSIYTALQSPSETTIALLALLIGLGFIVLRRVY